MKNNKYEVVITKPNGSQTIMNAIAETEVEAAAYVISKQARRVREAIEEGEYTVKVIGDINNK